MKKTTQKISALCAILVAVVCTCVVTNIVSAKEATNNSITEEKYGKLSDNDLFENDNLSQIIDKSIYARNNDEMRISNMMKNELVNRFAYEGTQEIIVYEDICTSESKIIFERPSDGKLKYLIYEFDSVRDCTAELESPRYLVVEFFYKGFRFTISESEKENKYVLTKKWYPDAFTNIYHVSEADSVTINKLKESFKGKEDVIFIKENGDNAPVHAFLSNGKQDEEFVFHNLSPDSTGNSESENDIIASIDTVDDNFTIYAENNKIYIKSAKLSAYNQSNKNSEHWVKMNN